MASNHERTEGADSDKGPTLGPKIGKQASFLGKTGKAFYYGLAVDSIEKSIGRTKKLVISTGRGALGLFLAAFRTPEFEKAKTFNEIVTVHDNCAQSIIYNVPVILLFGYFTLSSEGTYAAMVNSLITLSFVVYLGITIIVYLQAEKELLSKHAETSGESEK